jgi:DNA modification methylase
MQIEYGDKFKLGNHYLINGDCRDPKIIKKLLGEYKVKLILVDVPYGINLSQSKQSFIQTKTKHEDILNDHFQSDQEYADFTKEWLEVIKPYLTEKNAAYIFNSDKMIFALRQGMLQAGFKFSELLIWVKTHAIIGRMDYLPQHELIAYSWYGKHEFLKSKDKSVLIYPRPNRSKLHPTMKPVGLLRKLVLNSSRINDIVFDGFLGSGSTILACEQTRRRCYAVELEAKYCQVAIERFERLTNINVTKLNQGGLYENRQ